MFDWIQKMMHKIEFCKQIKICGDFEYACKFQITKIFAETLNFAIVENLLSSLFAKKKKNPKFQNWGDLILQICCPPEMNSV